MRVRECMGGTQSKMYRSFGRCLRIRSKFWFDVPMMNRWVRVLGRNTHRPGRKEEPCEGWGYADVSGRSYTRLGLSRMLRFNVTVPSSTVPRVQHAGSIRGFQ
jgi:hypothetical protein